MSKYLKYEFKFNGVYSKDNLPKVKDGAYIVNLGDKQSKGTHWISLLIEKNTAVYFDYFGKTN